MDRWADGRSADGRLRSRRPESEVQLDLLTAIQLLAKNLKSDLYHKLEGEMNIFKVNATANMASFDRTVDLSIDLLDRMVRITCAGLTLKNLNSP